MEPTIIAAIRADDYRDAHDLLVTKMASIWTVSTDGESAFELATRIGSDKMKSVFKTAAAGTLNTLFRE